MLIVNAKLKPLSVFVALAGTVMYSNVSVADVNTTSTQANGSVLDLSANPDTTIYAVNSSGAYVLRAYSGGTLVDDQNVLKEIYSDSRNGLSAEVGSKVVFDGNISDINITTGVFSTVSADGTSVTATPSSGAGIGVISKGAGSSVTLNRNITVTTHSALSSGVGGEAGGEVLIKGLTKINSAGTGISATGDSKVTLSGGAEITSAKEAIYANEGSEVAIGNSTIRSKLTTSASDLIVLDGPDTDGTLSFINSELSIASGNAVKVTGGDWSSTFTDSNITGDMNTDSGATLNTVMSNSEFTGKANGDIKLQATDSTWNMTDSSTITSL
ncbi:hypothetical protein I2494_00030 [Budviciaceae bacterium BWR-B9]|uniref:Autotransporter outer membrane beta-barrel domain-containing protein n=1 Tax=Limnobaculum allomyrinae TaxID=2791986 RepID=A0ABS1IK34_9GAMM|nr:MULTISPECIES: hypothetical protein [Limnobaculum]MBK5142117.1 hypothetical protein [Limnobaculum allomyrinae]MBV7690999.1 hypothetical protein [Limnobaculum sp. M2-1]